MLDLIFGNSGSGVAIFGGLGYLLAFFVLGFFVLMLFSQQVNGENLVFFILTFLLLTLFENLFNIPPQIVVTVIIFIVLFVSIYAYRVFNQGD